MKRNLVCEILVSMVDRYQASGHAVAAVINAVMKDSAYLSAINSKHATSQLNLNELPLRHVFTCLSRGCGGNCFVS